MVQAYAGVKFQTYAGLTFSYELRKGRNGANTKELWIDRRENSKRLAWSSVLLALKNNKGEVVDRLDVPAEVKEKMGRPINRNLHSGNAIKLIVR